MNEFLKERIRVIMSREPQALCVIAKKMKLDNVTFYSFWKDERKTSTKNLIVIENFLVKEEKRLGIS